MKQSEKKVYEVIIKYDTSYQIVYEDNQCSEVKVINSVNQKEKDKENNNNG